MEPLDYRARAVLARLHARAYRVPLLFGRHLVPATHALEPPD